MLSMWAARTSLQSMSRRSTVNLIELDLITEGVEDELAYTYEEDEVTGGDEGELLSCSLVFRKLLLAPKQIE